MKRFDCLSSECPVFGPHLLEASAGTGKTFAIEHVFVRLLLASVPLEEILAVTFTRPSARELKERIYANLKKAIACLKGEISPLPYLVSSVGSYEAIKILTDAIKVFDQCQIFTIHSFCFRMLQECSLSFPCSEGEMEIAKKVHRSFRDFLEKGDTDVCPEQMALLFGKYDTLEALFYSVSRAKKEVVSSFQKLHQKLMALHPTLTGIEEDFAKIRSQYKAMKGDFEEQLSLLVHCFQNPNDTSYFRKLIQAQGSLFLFLDSQNRKARTKESPTPQIFSWIVEHVGPIVFEAVDRKKIVAVLANAWKKWETEFLMPDGIFSHDQIILEMRRKIEDPLFRDTVKRRFSSVIIDEFQDTDPIQWEIFRNVFMDAKALYLVGDPKQSIYRFRNADVYTYFDAKNFLGEENVYHLDTNFRSSKELIGALNALFSRAFLPLPKYNHTIAYHPVKAGSTITSDFPDQKKALHWMIGKKEDLLPYIALEIEKLKVPYSSVAVLVKDRYEIQNAIEVLQRREIPVYAKSLIPLGKTEAFQRLYELILAIASPKDENLRKIVQAGPFAMADEDFFFWKQSLEEKGLVPFFSKYLKKYENLFIHDLQKIIEELFAWEQREGFSFTGLKRFCRAFEKLLPDEGGRCGLEVFEDAVQVMTMHVSKGLEFDVVFALGLGSSSLMDDHDPELTAEKLRQLYVVMTRAKKRLYVPFGGKSSPIDLFCAKLEEDEGPLIPYLQSLPDVSFEEISTTLSIEKTAVCKEKVIQDSDLVLTVPSVYETSFIQSFTSLSESKEEPIYVPSIEGEIPRGKETGTVIHAIFERLFNSPTALWQDSAQVDAVVEKELMSTSLQAWAGKVQEMVRKTLTMPLFDGEKTFSLSMLDRGDVFAEMEFLYSKDAHFMKGFIDLVFSYEGKLYFLDWKTNALQDLSRESMWEVMRAYDYPLQAEIYKEALRRHINVSCLDPIFGGAFYIFIRSEGYLHLFGSQKV